MENMEAGTGSSTDGGGVATLESAGAQALASMNTPEKAEEKNISPVADKEPAKSADDSGMGDKHPNQLEGIDEQTLKDIREGKIIPKYRFDEVSKKQEELASMLESYKTFGTPEQLKEIMAAMATLKNDKGSLPENPTTELDDDDKAMQAAILKLFPQLKSLGQDKTVEELKAQFGQVQKFVQAQQAEAKQQYDSFIGKASETIKGFAKEAGLNVDDAKNVNLLETVISQMIEAEPELAEQFYGKRDISVLKKVFDDYSSRFLSGVQRKVASDIIGDKKKMEKLPKAVAGTGTNEPEKKLDVKKFKSFADTQNVAKELLGE